MITYNNTFCIFIFLIFLTRILMTPFNILYHLNKLKKIKIQNEVKYLKQLYSNKTDYLNAKKKLYKKNNINTLNIKILSIVIKILIFKVFSQYFFENDSLSECTIFNLNIMETDTYCILPLIAIILNFFQFRLYPKSKKIADKNNYIYVVYIIIFIGYMNIPIGFLIYYIISIIVYFIEFKCSSNIISNFSKKNCLNNNPSKQ